MNKNKLPHKNQEQGGCVRIIFLTLLLIAVSLPAFSLDSNTFENIKQSIYESQQLQNTVESYNRRNTHLNRKKPKGTLGINSVCPVCPVQQNCPACPSTTCPTSNLCPPQNICADPNGFQQYLASSYRATVNVTQGQTESFQISIFGKDSSGVFQYDALDLINLKSVHSAFGSILYNLVEFNLPVINGSLVSAHCIGIIDITSKIQGGCNGIYSVNGNYQYFGGLFSAFPN